MAIYSKPVSKEYLENWETIHNMKKKIYLAGPMRGIPEFNFPAFFATADKLREQGHEVFNPAQRDVEKYGIEVCQSPSGNLGEINPKIQFSIREAMEADSVFICRYADAIALMPGWETSKGANAEKLLAEAIGLEVIYL